jgi:hypothetical protein
MTEHVARFVLPAALSLLPERMDSPAARAMLLSIGLQESRFRSRVQIGGPARGFWQFERNGGIKGVLTHPVTRPILLPVLDTLRYVPSVAVCYSAVEDNDTLACVFARLLLWTVPGRVARQDEPEHGWQDYLAGWRPGKPHRETWDACFAAGWQSL